MLLVVILKIDLMFLDFHDPQYCPDHLIKGPVIMVFSQ